MTARRTSAERVLFSGTPDFRSQKNDWQCIRLASEGYETPLLARFFSHFHPERRAEWRSTWMACVERTIKYIPSRHDHSLSRTRERVAEGWWSGVALCYASIARFRRSIIRQMNGVKMSCMVSSILPPGTTMVLARDINESATMFSK